MQRQLATTARQSLVPIGLSIGIFAALSVAAAVSSEGFLEADACTHYLYARFAWEQPHYFVNVWGRPICTGIYAVPALLGGRLGVRLMSCAIAIACALVAYRIAVNQRYRWPVLALIFTLAQPLVFLHSFSELTELPFSLLVGLAFWAYQRRRWPAMALLAGLMPLGRPEGFGFILLAAAALMAHRRWWWLLILPIPLILWNHAGWLLYGKPGPWWRWLADNWPYAGQSLYESGTVFRFVLFLPAIVSPIVFPATCVGITRSLMSRQREQTLIAAIPLLILLVHSVLYAAGRLASSGEIRYMLVVAPLWGLLSACGWQWVFERFNWRRPVLFAGIAALAPILANVYYKVVPVVLDEDWHRARRAVLWYQHCGIAADFPRIATAHQAIYYFMDMVGTSPRALEWRRELMADSSTPGVIVIYDPMYSIYNSDANRKVTLEDLRAAGWIDVTDRAATLGPGWHVLLSRKDAAGRDVDAQALRYFPSSP
ncbi:hypothetical protein [Fontivita pretiosa]|uniref:hypothetical protein n=1 Tax=Fontivita pretiosa TaxID=2989684 RepID=UPI003D175F5F